jgi:hypothetical protein
MNGGEMNDERWVGWAVAGGMLMVAIGFFRAISGLIGLFNDEWVVRGYDAYYFVDLTAVAWWTLLVGVLLIFGGLAVLNGQTWGRVVGIIFVTIAIISELFWLPIYPLWSMLLIALYVLMLLGLSLARVPRAE